MASGEPTYRPESIRELMRREGLNATTFAIQACVSRTLVGAWLSGTVTPQVGTLTRLCRVFNVPIAYFFVEVPEPEAAKQAS